MAVRAPSCSMAKNKRTKRPADEATGLFKEPRESVAEPRGVGLKIKGGGAATRRFTQRLCR